ncbi:1-deoxy-D-xylulose 5-phosphate synthase, putative [Eimeria maxima]|uniref:1-deoxy-D-xylulose 5-phosphate synthase, putative n=1 Tax=Eimeria maxima TaxID=5804 RepID=U6MF03_EIMMA|nr:1-deoxy-D-xylulose 5-phosphate synthase, putative [Eimeria maxima]CDJ61628.1 1-deoxy-D-xylulose 5-phosphate synthase, putative [Eimeria maxima]
MLTGRRHLMHRLRQQKGLSGFLTRKESIYDSFGAGHSSTSISALQGMYVAHRLQKRDKGLYVAVIGDGGLTGGMAYEALNACGFLRSPILIILNDNQQVSLPTGTNTAGGTAPASAVSRHMRRLKNRISLIQQQQQQQEEQQQQQDVAAVHAPGQGEPGVASFFGGLGFEYMGPVDGHDVLNLVSILQKIKSEGLKRPTVLHLKTEKGFIIDRAGLVGADGSTHQGSFDLSFLGNLPNFTVMAPSDEYELLRMLKTVYLMDSGPSALRFPRSPCFGLETLNSKLGHNIKELPSDPEPLPIGKGRILLHANPNAKYKVALLSIGTLLLDAVNAAAILQQINSIPKPEHAAAAVAAAEAAAAAEANAAAAAAAAAATASATAARGSSGAYSNLATGLTQPVLQQLQQQLQQQQLQA